MVDEVRFLNQRLRDVYAALKGKEDGEDNIPIFIHKFYMDDGNNDIRIVYNTVSNGNMKDTVFVEEDYILDCPQVGMTPLGKRVIFLRRVPERQWKRGYNMNIVRGETICHLEGQEIGFTRLTLRETDFINAIYNPKYPEFKDAIGEMERGNLLSFPLSRKFAIGLNYNSKFPVVYYKEWIVGWVEEEFIMLPEKTHHLFEELSQYVACRRV